MTSVICLLLWLAAPAGNRVDAGQPAMAPPFKAFGAFFALSVADLQASAAWYSEKLGMKRVMEVPKSDGTAVIVLEGGGLTVELIQHDNASPLSRAAPTATAPQLVHGIFKAGVIVDNIEQTVSMLKARGVDMIYGPYPAKENQKANVVIRDNSGNLIQFIGK